MKKIKYAVWTGLWVVGVKSKNGIYWPLLDTVASLRSGAINKYKSGYKFLSIQRPLIWKYENRRRRGELKAIRLYVRDTTKGGRG